MKLNLVSNFYTFKEALVDVEHNYSEYNVAKDHDTDMESSIEKNKNVCRPLTAAHVMKNANKFLTKIKEIVYNKNVNLFRYLQVIIIL